MLALIPLSAIVLALLGALYYLRPLPPTWSYPKSIASTSSVLTSISCPSKTFCMTTSDQKGNGFYTKYSSVIKWNGTRWSKPQFISPGIPFISSVSCTSKNFCMAVGSNFTGGRPSGSFIRWNGSKWSKPKSVAPGILLTVVSCTSKNFCMAGGNKTSYGIVTSGSSINWNGTRWSKPRSLFSTNITSISCPSNKFCMAVDKKGKAAQWNGSNWSSSKSIASSSTYLNSVSCPTKSFCMTSGAYTKTSGHITGIVMEWNGSRWSHIQSIIPNRIILNLSCLSTNFCMAVNDKINLTLIHFEGKSSIFSWNGSKWSPPKSIDSGKLILAVSCPTTHYCKAVDEQGHVINFARGA